jgi:hypothetical protein
MEDVSLRSVLLALACGIASAVVTLIVLPRLSAIRRAHWKGQPVVRVALRAAMAGGIPALAVAIGFVRVVALDERTAVVTAATIGAAVFLGSMAVRYAPMRRLHALLPRLAADTTRAGAVTEIEQLIDRTRPAAQGGPWLVTWVSTVLNAAEHLANAGELDAASRTLARLAGLRLSGVLESLKGALGALVKVHLGEREAAVDALASIRRPAELPMVEAMVVSLESLVEAVDGRHEQALRRLAKWGYPDEWHVRSRLVAKAHALEASGDEPGARRTLHEIERRFGPRGLQIAASVEGPASELARSMGERRAPT